MRSYALLLALCLTACRSVEPQGWGLPRDGAIAVVEEAQVTSLVSAPAARPRVVNFWATWCPPCIAELPELESFARSHPEVDVVLINADLPSRPVGSFLTQRGVVSTQNARVSAADPAATLGALVPGWSDAIPYTLVIDREGTLRSAFHQPVNQRLLAESVRGL